MAEESRQLDDELDMSEIKVLFDADREHSAEWRRQAYEDFEFAAGRQWTPDEEAYLAAHNRPVVTFNRVNPIIHAVAGSEIKNREEVRFHPVEEGDIQPNDILTQAAQWFRQKADADAIETEAFYDALVCGMGWTRTTIDYEEDPDGMPAMEHIDPLEMVWDRNSRKKCLSDATRFWHVRTMTLAEAMQLFPDADPEDLDATWAVLDVIGSARGDNDVDYDDELALGDDKTENGSDLLREVRIVHLERRESKEMWRVFDPFTQQDVWLDDEGYQKLLERVNAFNEQALMTGGHPLPPVEGIRQKRTFWKRYFIGAKVLDAVILDTKYSSFQCITGYRDHNNGTWFGLLAMMRDPQKWANKWLSQILHLVNSLAKSGVMVERGAVDNPDEFRRSWAKADEVTFVERIEGVKEKPQQTVPSHLFSLMQYAIQSITDVSGVNPEILGQRSAIQPIGLEQERKESAMTILANLFDSLRLYRKRQGTVMFDLIRNYLADGRLIRIVGENGAQMVPLAIRQDLKYDVFVDEAPQSPYIKERVWSFISPLLTQIPPQITAQLMDFAPIPSSVAEKIKAALMQLGQPDPVETAKQQLELQKLMADMEMTKSAAMNEQAEAQERVAKAEKARADINLKVAEIATEAIKE